MTTKSKLPNLSPSIFTTMSQMAHEYDAINLSQGFPNFAPDPKLIELVTHAMEAGYNQYAPLGGIYSLREVISEKIESLYGRTYHPENEITVTVGATQAIYTAIAALVWPGDEVIVFKPAYDCYEPAIKAQGGVPVLLQLQGTDFSIDWNSFSNAIGPKTRMVIINTPHNPSGEVMTAKEMLKLQSALEGTDIVVLSDEVYEHLVFDGELHQSVSRYEDLSNRSLVCASFGKTFHVTGWKMGYCAAPKYLMDEFKKIHEFTVFCTNHPMQRALATYLKNPEHYLGLSDFFQRKRDLFLGGLKESRFTFTPSKGTYFQLLNFSAISDESDIVFSERLTKEMGVASIPISVFNKHLEDHSLLRFCFAKTDDTLQKAVEILCKI